MAHPQYSYAMPNESQLELDSLEELDEFDYDPNFFDGITFNKENDPTIAQPVFLRPYPESPSPSLTGYTSEESGYSSSMSVDDHGGKWSPTSDASSTSKRSTINDGMMTNGKTSIYRGVTRTSKTAWGAKYSSKRIVNTCKTEAEAARKYDEYIKLHVPDKYLKYANFCPDCDKYTNSLGLSWTVKECRCLDGGDSRFVETTNAVEQQALADFLKDEQIDLSSPYFDTQNIVEAIPVIKTEPQPPMLRCSSSIPDDEILSAILNAPMQQNSMFGSFQGDDMLVQFPPEQDPPLKMETLFLRKYFRNDRKNLQCFPYCREHGNYYEAKMNGLEHTGKGVCRAPVKVKVSHFSQPPTSTQPMIVLARCQKKYQRHGVVLNETVSVAKLQELQNHWVRGTTSESTADQTTVYFLPEVWKFDGELPKKRRLDDSDVEDLQYFVQVVLYLSQDGGQTYTLSAMTESNPFDIQSTRTLLRQKQREDAVIGVPDKKKLRIAISKNGRSSITDTQLYTSVKEGEVEIDLSVIDWGKPGEPIDETSASTDVEVSPTVEHVSVEPVSTSAPFVSMETPSYRDVAKESSSEHDSPWKERFVVGPLLYSFLNIPLGVLYLVVHILLIPVSWAGSIAFNMSDGIADLDLYLANSLSPQEEHHVMLHRLSQPSQLFQRIGFYVVVKLPVALIAFLGSFLFNILALITIIIPSLSRSMRVAANSCGMLSIDGCKRTCGQLKQSIPLNGQRGDMV